MLILFIIKLTCLIGINLLVVFFCRHESVRELQELRHDFRRVWTIDFSQANMADIRGLSEGTE